MMRGRQHIAGSAWTSWIRSRNCRDGASVGESPVPPSERSAEDLAQSLHVPRVTLVVGNVLAIRVDGHAEGRVPEPTLNIFRPNPRLQRVRGERVTAAMERPM